MQPQGQQSCRRRGTNRLLWALGLFGAVYSSLIQAQPVSDYKFSDGPLFISPDGTLTVEEYIQQPVKDFTHYFEFWVVDRSRKHWSQINRGETGDCSVYPAGFRFSADSQWLVRMQKIAAGESTLFLYHREGLHFVPATGRQLGDLAWDFFFTQPAGVNLEAHGINLNDLSPETALVAGMEKNYANLGMQWPDSRYIVISLGSDESGTYPLGPWRCVYDVQTSHFFLPPEAMKFNQIHAKQEKSDQQNWITKNHKR